MDLQPTQKEWAASRYKVDILNTWDMTVTPVNTIFEMEKPDAYRVYDKKHQTVTLPDEPYLALRIKMIN